MKQADFVHHRTQLRDIVTNQGIRDGLIYLNGLTDHRFTALYRFDNETLKKKYFYDRDNPALDECEDIAIEASYCVYIKNSGAEFSTENSLEDSRVADHPKRETILSYCGVPLTDSAGVMFGSICHFDFNETEIEINMVELMESLATIIMETEELKRDLPE